MAGFLSASNGERVKGEVSIIFAGFTLTALL
jgi:hypothetical protein